MEIKKILSKEAIEVIDREKEEFNKGTLKENVKKYGGYILAAVGLIWAVRERSISKKIRPEYKKAMAEVDKVLDSEVSRCEEAWNETEISKRRYEYLRYRAEVRSNS